jgi:putative salt-induced outer membrane protein
VAIKNTVTAVVLIAVHAAACAANEDVDSWHTAAELGAISTSGNTEGISVTGKIDARQELLDWSNQYIATGHFKQDETTSRDGSRVTRRSAERYALSAKAAYKLVEKDEKLFVLATHVDDKFGAYTSYSTLAVGRGTRWITTPEANMDVEVGPGYFVGERANGEEESGFTVRGAAAVKWQVSPVAQFSQTVSVERGTSNVHSIAESALSTKINGTMQMKAAFIARNDTSVPETRKNTDTQTSVTLVYSF